MGRVRRWHEALKLGSAGVWGEHLSPVGAFECEKDVVAPSNERRRLRRDPCMLVVDPMYFLPAEYPKPEHLGRTGVTPGGHIGEASYRPDSLMVGLLSPYAEHGE